MTIFYTLNNRVYYVPVEAIPRLTDAMCREGKTRDGRSIYVIQEALPNYLRDVFDNLRSYTFNQVIGIVHNRSHPLLNLGEVAFRRIEAYAGPYRGFLRLTCQAFFKRMAPNDNCLAMAGAGDLAMLKKLKPKIDRMEGICKSALAGSGSEKARLDVLKWLVKEQGYDINLMPFDYAAQYGHIKILEWARRETSGYLIKSSLPNIMTEVAIDHGQVEVLEWALLKGANIKNIVFNYDIAGGRGHLNVLQWAQKNGVKLRSYPFMCAAGEGHLQILKWGFEAKLFELNELFFQSVSNTPHFEVIKWLKAKGAPIDWKNFNPNRIVGCHKIEAIIWASDNGLDEEKVKEYLAQAEPHKKIA